MTSVHKSAAGECLDDESVLALFGGRLRPEPRRAVLEHIDVCADCRELVATLAKEPPEGATSPDATLPGEAIAPTRAPSLRAGDRVGGRFVLERIVGRGGVGVVWAARGDAGPVALKALRVTRPSFVQRLRREARLTAELAHPAIARVREVIDAAECNGPVLVMDLLVGESFDATLARERRIDVRALAAVLLPVCDALAVAHARGVVHRDLKPSNVFLASDGPKLLDFGIAKVLAPSDDGGGATPITRTGELLGTPQYMAPEQVFSERGIDARADVWALGAIAYHALSGTLPFDARALGPLLKAHARGTVTPLATRAPDVPAAVADVVMGMLTRDRAARVADVRAIAAAFAPYATGC